MSENTQIAEKDIKSIIDALCADMWASDYNMARELISLLEKDKSYYENLDTFRTKVSSKLDRAMEQAIMFLLPEVECKNTFKPVWIYMEYGYLTNHIRKLKAEVTGSSSSEMDVARFIAKMYLRYSIDGYIPETDYGEYYHKPTFGENEDWIDYCDGLYELFYGRPEKYLKAYQKLISSPVRKYKHTLYQLFVKMKTGEEFLVDHNWDEVIEIPKGDYVFIAEWFLPAKKAALYEKEERGIFRKVPKSEIEEIYVTSEEKEV